MAGRLRWKLGRQSCLREEMPKLDQLGTGKILGVGFAYEVAAIAGDLKDKLAIGFLVDVANDRDQSDDVAPFEIVGGGMTEYRFEGATVRAGYF